MRPVRSFLLLALLVLPAFAGCLAAPADPGAGPASAASGMLACFADACNFRTTVAEKEQGNEVTIALNPKDPNTIVAAAKDYQPDYAGDCVWIGVYVSKDGGKSWTDHHVPGSPHLLTSRPEEFQQTPMSQFWCTTDPVLAFGADGTCYLVIMAYQADPVTSSKVGAGVLPMGGLNDFAFNRASQIVGISRDDCATFESFSPVADGSYPVNFHDKAWIAVGEDGTIHMAWLQFGAEAAKNTYYRSTDKGKSWEGPLTLGYSATAGDLDPLGVGAPAGQGTMIATLHGGKDVYVTWGADKGVFVAHSGNGGKSFETAKMGVKTEDKGMNATYRSGGMPFLAADQANERLYLAWQDTRFGDRDVLVSASGDGGKTWSEPARVNDDPKGDGHDQFFPALGVGPDGVVDLAWYDRRDDPGHVMLNLYYSYSTDGGATWAPNQKVTEKPTDPSKSHHQNGAVFLGDYIDLDSSLGAAHPVWVDTRNGVADVYTATLVRGPNATAALPAGATLGSG